jgi:radical SAM superfamily enzyme YgiQ (UPF0313 family)
MSNDPKRLKVVLCTLNKPRNYSLALRYLKVYALADKELAPHVRFAILESEVQQPTNQMLLRILLERPDVVGFSCNIWNISRVLKIARRVKALRPGIRIVAGGQEMTGSVTDYMALHPCIDILVDGEGEEVFRRVLRSLVFKRGEGLDEIPGIRFRAGETIVANPPAPLIKNLDDIPSPYLADEIHIRPDHHLGAMIETSRGCPFRCAFCFEGSRFNCVRYFSMERVEREIAHLASRGVSSFHILDPVLGNARTDRLEELHRIVQKHLGPRRPYSLSVELHAELLKEESVRFLEVFTLFDIGLQAVHPDALRHINRKIDWPRFLKGMELLKQLPYQQSLYILMGVPGDNFFRFLQSVKASVELDVPRLFVNHLCVLNGTGLRRDAASMKLLFKTASPFEAHSNYTFSEAEMHLGHVYGDSVMREHDSIVLRAVKRLGVPT